MSRQVPLRPDLAPLARQLSAEEPSGATWSADGIGSLVTRMRPDGGHSELDRQAITDTVIAYLKTAPPAWDPFRRGGALIPLRERRPPD